MADIVDFKVKNGLIVSSTASIRSADQSNSTQTGALQVAGGIGIGDSVYVGNKVGFVSPVTQASAAYQYFNTATNSIDTVFG